MFFERLFEPRHPASLAVTRILFGFLMVFDIPGERGGSEIDLRWGDPKTCHFPLFDGLWQPTYPWMCIIFGVMWLGALGICLGYKFKSACLAFLLPYWYIILLDKSFWNNHTYLFGLLGILIYASSANCYWSFDAWKLQRPRSVPYWNYFLLKFQVFCLYFMAGLKKMDMEWLDGYSMTNLGKHWVFKTFGFILSTELIDYLIVHWTGFLIDLTVGFFLIYEKTRSFALLICGLFHLMNSRLFSIGMFPYIGIATMPLFCKADWPIRLLNELKKCMMRMKKCNRYFVLTSSNLDSNQIQSPSQKKRTIFFICFYCYLQLFLPWSHFLTKGYNNWTNGMYGYSWDMMVHSWDTLLVTVKIVDNESKKEAFLDPNVWTLNDRWNKHADMLLQYAKCVERNLKNGHQSIRDHQSLSDNISVYVDVWCSLNGRFQQRVFHPHCDLLQVEWSPFYEVKWLMPLVKEFNSYRPMMRTIQRDVYSWSNYSDVVFVSDFPGLWFENFIAEDLSNMSLAIIDGKVYFQNDEEVQGVVLEKGDRLSIQSKAFHKVKTIGTEPSRFMYTFVNRTKMLTREKHIPRSSSALSPFPLLESSQKNIDSLIAMFGFIKNALLHFLYNIPMDGRSAGN